jgi:hypothetical protein
VPEGFLPPEQRGTTVDAPVPTSTQPANRR